jgi:predicted deacetylase
MNARFLIRFDDICPTSHWDRWQAIETVMIEEDVRPILSVIPDNQDRNLYEAAPDPNFWDRVRNWQARGWTIGLHGYQHNYVSTDAGLLKLKNYSEFAGLPFDEQRDKLKKGTAIFAQQGVRPDVWVAPAHSFDANTVRALGDVGIRTISDGLSVYPHRDSQGVFWVPQQLWRFRNVPFGVWTVCIHSKDKLFTDPKHFRASIRAYRKSITTIPAVVEEYSKRSESWVDDAFARVWGKAIRVKVKLANRPPEEEHHEAAGFEAAQHASRTIHQLR